MPYLCCKGLLECHLNNVDFVVFFIFEADLMDSRKCHL